MIRWFGELDDYLKQESWLDQVSFPHLYYNISMHMRTGTTVQIMLSDSWNIDNFIKWACTPKGVIRIIFSLLLQINQNAQTGEQPIVWTCEDGDQASPHNTAVSRRPLKICLQQRPNPNWSPREWCGKETFLLSSWRVTEGAIVSCSTVKAEWKVQSFFSLFFFCVVTLKAKGGFVFRLLFALTHPEDVNSVLWFPPSNYITLLF